MRVILIMEPEAPRGYYIPTLILTLWYDWSHPLTYCTSKAVNNWGNAGVLAIFILCMSHDIMDYYCIGSIFWPFKIEMPLRARRIICYVISSRSLRLHYQNDSHPAHSKLCLDESTFLFLRSHCVFRSVTYKYFLYASSYFCDVNPVALFAILKTSH